MVCHAGDPPEALAVTLVLAALAAQVVQGRKHPARVLPRQSGCPVLSRVHVCRVQGPSYVSRQWVRLVTAPFPQRRPFGLLFSPAVSAVSGGYARLISRLRVAVMVQSGGRPVARYILRDEVLMSPGPMPRRPRAHKDLVSKSLTNYRPPSALPPRGKVQPQKQWDVAAAHVKCFLNGHMLQISMVVCCWSSAAHSSAGILGTGGSSRVQGLLA